jgi:HEAT repeat protein
MKIGLGALLIAVLAVGYGVYWWYEAALDDQVAAARPGEFAVVTAAEIRKQLLATEFKEKAAGITRLEKLDAVERVEVLRVMAEDPSQVIRMIAVPMIGKLKDRSPRMRAILVKLVQSDPEKDVRDAAKEALGGGGSP